MRTSYVIWLSHIGLNSTKTQHYLVIVLSFIIDEMSLCPDEMASRAGWNGIAGRIWSAGRCLETPSGVDCFKCQSHLPTENRDLRRDFYLIHLGLEKRWACWTKFSRFAQSFTQNCCTKTYFDLPTQVGGESDHTPLLRHVELATPTKLKPLLQVYILELPITVEPPTKTTVPKSILDGRLQWTAEQTVFHVQFF